MHLITQIVKKTKISQLIFNDKIIEQDWILQFLKCFLLSKDISLKILRSSAKDLEE